MNLSRILSCAALAFAVLAQPAFAKLPPPTEAQLAEAAAKKAAAAAQAEKDKQELFDTMDTVAKRWRAGAASRGQKTYPAVPLPPPPAPAPVAAVVPPPPAR